MAGILYAFSIVGTVSRQVDIPTGRMCPQSIANEAIPTDMYTS